MGTSVKRTVRNFLSIYPYVLVAVIILLFIVNGKQKKAHEDTVSALQSEMKVYKLKNQKLVSSKETVKLNNDLLKEVIKKNETTLLLAKQFTKVKTLTKVITKVRIDTIEVVFRDSIPCVFSREEIVDTKDYKLKIKSTQKGVVINDLELTDTISLISGTKRKWFLGKTTNTIDVTHSNKHIKTVGLEHYELENKVRFYETTLFKVAVGVLGGFLIAK